MEALGHIFYNRVQYILEWFYWISKLCHTFNTPIVLFALFQVKNFLTMVFHDTLAALFVFTLHFCQGPSHVLEIKNLHVHYWNTKLCNFWCELLLLFVPWTCFRIFLGGHLWPHIPLVYYTLQEISSRALSNVGILIHSITCWSK